MWYLDLDFGMELLFIHKVANYTNSNSFDMSLCSLFCIPFTLGFALPQHLLAIFCLYASESC